MLARLAGWLWRRFRSHYLGAIILLIDGFMVVGFAPISALVLCFYFELSFAQALTWDLVVSAAIVAGVEVTRRWLMPVARPAVAWARGEQVDPHAAWTAALRIPRTLMGRGFIILTVATEVASVATMHALVHPPVKGLLALAFIVPVLLLTVSTIGASTVQELLRVPLTELVGAVPDQRLPERAAWGLRFRVLGGSGGGLLVSGVGVTAFVLASSAEVDDYFVTMLAAVGVAGAMAFLISVGLVDPTLSSIRELVAATRRVRAGNFADPVPVVAADELGELAAAFNEMQTGLRERQSLHAAFGSYVDPALTQRLLDQNSSIFEGEDVEVTVFFLDVRGFSGYAETVTAREAVQQLNDLFALAVPIIRDNGGHANHYVGDGVLAVFGTPNPLPDHAERAVQAATVIQRAVRAAFGDTMRVGIGINTGHVIAGTVGGAGRLEFTVIGDVVNVASRIEQLTRETGDDILLSAATLARCDQLAVVDRGEFVVRGRTAKQRVHAINI